MPPYATGSPYGPSVLTQPGPLRPCQGLTPVRSPTSHRPSPQGLRGRKGQGLSDGTNTAGQEPTAADKTVRNPRRLKVGALGHQMHGWNRPRRETRGGAGEPHAKTPFDCVEARLQPRCSPIPCTRPTEGEGSPWATPSRAPAGHPVLAAHSLALVAPRTASAPARAGPWRLALVWGGVPPSAAAPSAGASGLPPTRRRRGTPSRGVPGPAPAGGPVSRSPGEPGLPVDRCPGRPAHPVDPHPHPRERAARPAVPSRSHARALGAPERSEEGPAQDSRRASSGRGRARIRSRTTHQATASEARVPWAGAASSESAPFRYHRGPRNDWVRHSGARPGLRGTSSRGRAARVAHPVVPTGLPTTRCGGLEWASCFVKPLQTAAASFRTQDRHLLAGAVETSDLSGPGPGWLTLGRTGERTVRRDEGRRSMRVRVRPASFRPNRQLHAPSQSR